MEPQTGHYNSSPTMWSPQQPISHPNQTSSSLKVTLYPPTVLMAVGWPTGSGSLNSSVAGTDELQYFINTFPAAATAAGVDYYWFEGYDEPWKIVYDTPTEQYEDHWVSSCRRGTNFRDYWM